MRLSDLEKNFPATHTLFLPKNFAPRAYSYKEDARFFSLRGRQISLVHLLATPFKVAGKIALIISVSLTTPLYRLKSAIEKNDYLEAGLIIATIPSTVPLDLVGGAIAGSAGLIEGVVRAILGTTIYPKAMIDGSAYSWTEVHPYRTNLFGFRT